MQRPNWIVRILFLAAAALVGVAVLERLVNLAGYTLVWVVYDPSRLIEFSAVVLLFAVALLLRDIRYSLMPKSSETGNTEH